MDDNFDFWFEFNKTEEIKQKVKEAMVKNNMNKVAAANDLGFTIKQFYNILHYHNLFDQYATSVKEIL